MRLDVPLTVAAERDGDALARAAFAARALAFDAAAADEKTLRDRLKTLERLQADVLGAAPSYPPETLIDGKPDPTAQIGCLEAQILERLAPDPGALAQLGRDRAQVAQAALLANSGLNPERVFITTDRKAAVTSGGAVRMEMKLEQIDAPIRSCDIAGEARGEQR